MGLSFNRFTYDGTDEFDLNFAMGYTNPEDVTAQTVTDPVVALDFDWLSDNQVRLAAGHGLEVGDRVEFLRTVSKRNFPVNIKQPGEATRENLLVMWRHVMHAYHELLDGRIVDEGVVDDVTDNILDNLAVEVHQFEQMFFGFYNTFDGQVEYIVTATDVECKRNEIAVDVQTAPTDTVEFLIKNDGAVKATITIGPAGLVNRFTPDGVNKFTITAGQVTCELNSETADATLECGITLIGSVDIGTFDLS